MLGVAPADCVVLEDSEVGIRAGRAAGMAVVGVGRRAAAFAPDVHVADLTRLGVEPGTDGTIRLRVVDRRTGGVTPHRAGLARELREQAGAVRVDPARNTWGNARTKVADGVPDAFLVRSREHGYRDRPRSTSGHHWAMSGVSGSCCRQASVRRERRPGAAMPRTVAIFPPARSNVTEPTT